MAINGSIKYLKYKKRNQFAVHPPTTEFTEKGVPKTPKAICYVNDWYSAFEILTALKAGNYTPGMECTLKHSPNKDKFVESIISDYTRFTGYQRNSEMLSFSEVYQMFYEDKFVNTKKQYSASSEKSYYSAYKNCSSLHEKPFQLLTIEDLQATIDGCKLKHSSLELIKLLYSGMYKFACSRNIVDKNLAPYVKITIPDDDVHGVPFSIDEIRKIYSYENDQTACRIIIMCFSGYRVSAFKSLEIHENYFIGGNKTQAGKNNLVPIHSDIKKLVKTADLNNLNPVNFRRKMYQFLDSIGIEKHTPHDCKHTFSMLCDKYKVNEIARKKMLGHALDMSNDIYGHWDYDMLKEEIEKIKIFY